MRGELWQLSLLQAVSAQTAAAARAGLRADVTFNTNGLRLVVSGYAQKLPRFMVTLLRRTLRHQVPPADSTELAAARRAGLSALAGRGAKAATARDELAKATPEEVQSEIAQLWRSVRSAQLLLAGDVGLGAWAFTA